MFWFRPWHHHMWHRHHCRPMGCGCLWLLLALFFFCVAWAFFGAFTRTLWW